MLDKIFQYLYNKIFVTIVVNDTFSTVHVEVVSHKGSVQDSATKEFETTSLSDDMYDYIEHYTEQSPYYYISVLDYSLSQGAVPTCRVDDFSLYTDLLSLKHKCFKDSWAFFTTKQNIKEIEKNYEDIGVDFIFSPFLVLSHFFKDKLDEKNSMFVFVQEDAVSICVFSHSELLYATHKKIVKNHHEEEDELVMEDDMLDMDDDAIELDSIDLDDVDIDDAIGGSLDDFGDIEDLDSLDEIEDFSDSKDLEEELEDEYEEANEEDEKDKDDEEDEPVDSKDYDVFLIIQNAMEHFYKDDIYKSEFVEKIYVADSIGLDDDLKKYLEDEMFVSAYIRKADLLAEVLDITKMELDL